MRTRGSGMRAMQVPRVPQDSVQLEGGAEPEGVSATAENRHPLKIPLIVLAAIITIAWIAFLSILAANFVRSFQ
jgi:hypothetical protein